MSHVDRIEAGNRVSVFFGGDEGECYLDAIVLHVPVATGDAWHLRTARGDLVYVQTYESIRLEQKGNPTCP